MCGASELLQGMVGGWVVVGPTCGGLFIVCTLISCQVCIWLTVCGASELLQGMVGGWVVVGPTHGRLFIVNIINAL